jgi:hypothetical protein
MVSGGLGLVAASGRFQLGNWEAGDCRMRDLANVPYKVGVA